MSLNIITVTLNMGESGETTLLSTYCLPDSGKTQMFREAQEVLSALKELSFFHKPKLVYNRWFQYFMISAMTEISTELWKQRMAFGQASWRK